MLFFVVHGKNITRIDRQFYGFPLTSDAKISMAASVFMTIKKLHKTNHISFLISDSVNYCDQQHNAMPPHI
jgi:hypothetical protein